MYRFNLKSKVTCHSRADNIVVASWFKEQTCEMPTTDAALKWMEAEMRKEFEDKDIYITVETRILDQVSIAPTASTPSPSEPTDPPVHRFRI